MRLLVRAFWAFVFFTLFAFALNNEQVAEVHGFFGTQWRAPMVIVVLVAFSLGAAFGVMAMVPGWWRQRRLAQQSPPATAAEPTGPRSAEQSTSAAPSGYPADGPPREGL